MPTNTGEEKIILGVEKRYPHKEYPEIEGEDVDKSGNTATSYNSLKVESNFWPIMHFICFVIVIGLLVESRGFQSAQTRRLDALERQVKTIDSRQNQIDASPKRITEINNKLTTITEKLDKK